MEGKSCRVFSVKIKSLDVNVLWNLRNILSRILSISVLKGLLWVIVQDKPKGAKIAWPVSKRKTISVASCKAGKENSFPCGAYS